MIFSFIKFPPYLAMLAVTSCCFGLPTQIHPETASVSTLYQFERGSWLENLKFGPFGSILATRLDKPILFQITLPSAHHPPSARLIHTFPDSMGTVGITEYSPNRFKVILGNYSIEEAQPTPGSYSVWDVGFSGRDLSHASAKKVTDIPEGQFLNGMATLDSREGTVLIGDSWAGLVYRLSADGDRYEVVLEDETMKPPNGSVLGLNGIQKVVIGKDTFVYYTNSLKETLNRVKIHPISGRAIGPYTTLATGVFGDDFAYDQETGAIYMAGNPTNVITKVNKNGKTEEVIGSPDQLTVAGATSVVIGQGNDRTLYVTTCGALASPVNGTITEGAKLVAIRIMD